jgi:4-hydroxy-tetrahydrodipicolinate reductase
MLRIALIGYGKMGKAIEQEALARGHKIAARFGRTDVHRFAELSEIADVAIEFTRPESAINNLHTLLELKIPTVCGTTGWLEHFDSVCEKVLKQNGAFLYASNFSVGVNVTMAVNRYLAQLMAQFSDYEVSMTEIHHIHKLDAPSGTGITLANDIIARHPVKKQWSLRDGNSKNADNKNALYINAIRQGEVPGTHEISYSSPIDTITLKHEAHNRKGFALGAVLAAEWIVGKTGVFSMNNVLNIQ